MDTKISCPPQIPRTIIKLKGDILSICFCIHILLCGTETWKVAIVLKLKKKILTFMCIHLPTIIYECQKLFNLLVPPSPPPSSLLGN